MMLSSLLYVMLTQHLSLIESSRKGSCFNTCLKTSFVDSKITMLFKCVFLHTNK